jgi:1-aminocyclopropane-1-carboxylate deaminase/D-cysteine desulfhydrase-like pyridoxal-dependent ACC family enzyme
MSASAAGALALLPRVDLLGGPTRVERWARLEDAIGLRPGTLRAKRDDAAPLGFGGNKIRKLEFVVARALAEGADTLVTCGGVQSNHARATAAAAARHGLGCHLVLSGVRPEPLTGNARLDELLGATLRFVADRAARAPEMERAAAELRAAGRKPFVVPLGASTPLGAAAFACGFLELAAQGGAPDVIVHASSSGGTQAGLVAGVALAGLSGKTRVIGVSADEPKDALASVVRDLARGALDLAGFEGPPPPVEVDDGFVGAGYGVATEASREAQSLLARNEGLFSDHTYTAKALACLVARARGGDFAGARAVLFWHTGGQPGLLA